MKWKLCKRTWSSESFEKILKRTPSTSPNKKGHNWNYFSVEQAEFPRQPWKITLQYRLPKIGSGIGSNQQKYLRSIFWRQNISNNTVYFLRQ